MPPSSDDAPSRPETIVAYAGAALATLVWVGCVIPGSTLVDVKGNDEEATPLFRGAILLLPALFLYITGSVGTTLAAGATTLRAALAAGDGFVTLYVAGALSWTQGGDAGLAVVVGLLLAIGFLSLREAVRVVSIGGEGDADAPPAERPRGRWGDLRLALALLVVIAPASVLSMPGRELASLLAPFVYVAISAAGARLSTTVRGLRRTAAILMTLIAAHLVVAIRYVLDAGRPAVLGPNAAGYATVGVAAAVFVLTAVRVVLLLRRRERVA